jgi:sugar transferase (PEP-CTERM/EpsH1 system associated)
MMQSKRIIDRGANAPLIAHVIHSLDTGGLENGLINIINRTPENRYRHAIICLTKTGSFAERITQPGVEVISLHGREGHDFGLYWELWKRLRALRPAIVHTRNLSALEAQIPAFFLPGVKTLHGVHGRDVFDLEGKSRKYNLLRRFIRPLVGRYITVSKDLRNWLIKTINVPEERVVQIYNGVDRRLFHPRQAGPNTTAPDGFLTEGAVVIGTVGRLAGVKDQATLIRAFKELLQTGNDKVRLIIAGDGPQRGQLQHLITELQLDKKVWMAGDRSDIPDILRTFDIFVLPSQGEGISNTILEAMATGLPVVATRVGGNPELVQDGVNGYLVPRSDPGALAKAIKELVDDNDKRARTGNTSLEFVRGTFDWDKTVTCYLSVYDELLNR